LFGHTFPIAPYFDFRFSNGPVWIEHFPGELFDYAYGGAVLNNSNTNGGPPSAMAQINDYLIGQHFNVSSIADETQYVFWAGANDILDTAQDTPQYVNNLVFDIPYLTTLQIGKLIKAGAKNILVMLLPSWANTPVVTETATAEQIQQFAQLTIAINGYIQSNLTALQAPGINLQIFDLPTALGKILQDPQAYGYVNVTAPCLANWPDFINGTGGVTAQVCSNPDEFFFWDGEHPSARTHGLLAQEVLAFLGWE
jgi:thermolabile hemolysin